MTSEHDEREVDRSTACKIVTNYVSTVAWGDIEQMPVRTWLLMYAQAITDLANGASPVLRRHLAVLARTEEA